MAKVRLAVLLTVLIVPSLSQSIEPPSDMADMDGALVDDAVSAFLGIFDDFGRWENGVIPITYNPLDAPAEATVSIMEEKLRHAFSVLEGAADLEFQYLGASDTDINDRGDGIVVVGWDILDFGIAGRAGPDYGNLSLIDRDTRARLGYWPYLDGKVRFSLNHSIPADSTVIHELIHLLGFGHSETPLSIMNTTLHRFDVPQQDDLDALQALYGPPDALYIPQPTIDLSAEALRSGIELDSISFRIMPDGQAGDVLDRILRVDAETLADAWIMIEVNYTGIIPGEELTVYITDPGGNILVYDPFALTFDTGRFRTGVGRTGGLRLQPGTWTVTVGIDGGFLSEVQLPVASDPLVLNQRPSAALSVSSDQNGSFDLNLSVNDAEGDGYGTIWYLPNQDDIADVEALDYFLDSDQPVQMFVEIHEHVERTVDISGGAGTGYAALASAYLATPAEPGIPTYFVSQQLLHIPQIEIEGQDYSLNFKLTSADTIRLKYLESQLRQTTGATEAAVFDELEQSISIPRLIVNNHGELSEFSELKFILDMTSSPISLLLTEP